MSDFDTLRSILSRWPKCDWVDLTSAPESRLANALQSLQKTERHVGPGDIAGLVRHVLRSQSQALPMDILEERGPALDYKTKNSTFLKVPNSPLWPTPSIWQQFGCMVARENDGFFEVTSRAWTPSWLDGTPGDAAFVGTSRVTPSISAADPEFARLTRYQHYTSPGQREAVRSAFLLQPGRTLLVNLPTGSGKSSVFQAPAIASAQRGRLSIIVMPTTALARDQEARFQSLLTQINPQLGNVPVAYHSGLGSDLKDAYRRRVRSGEQVVILASPEAILSGLRLALLDAARRASLDWFVVDEAHVVDQWGADFRPEFQLLAAFRNELQEIQSARGASFRSLLLTATLTNSTLRTLETLYGSPTLEVLSAIHIRPEPEYWLAAAPDIQQKERWLREAVRHLPRPLILYTTRRDAAEQWQGAIREMGIQRVGMVRGGDSATDEGGELLRNWKAGQIDIIVATSAFGLGMDYDRVRTVLHACVPENVDRFYQEVGRGGRDGNASVSLTIYTQEDRNDAKTLASKTLIGDKKGFAYWKAMWNSRSEIPGVEDGWVINLKSQPSHMNWDASYIKTWNTRTLLLLARAGHIRLMMPPLGKSLQRLDETDQDYEDRIRSELDLYFSQAAFVVVAPPPDNIDGFSAAVAGARAEINSSSQNAHDQMLSLLEANTNFNAVFKETYTLSGLPAIPSTPRGSCPLTRSRGTVDFGFAWPEPIPISSVGSCLSPQLSIFRGPGPHWVFYEPPLDRPRERRKLTRALGSFIAAAISYGIDELAISECLAREFSFDDFVANSKCKFLVLRNFDEADPDNLDYNVSALPLNRITVFGPSKEVISDHLFGLSRPFHLVVFPHTIRDSVRHDRTFAETRSCVRLETVKEAWATCQF